MIHGNPALSLVVSTKGRALQLSRLLKSLQEQAVPPFELIVVEQNEVAIVPALLPADCDFPIRHIHTPDESGASRGRNRGLEVASGDFVIFPDDDCWYPPRFIEHATRKITELRLDALTGRCTDESGRTMNGRFLEQAQWICRDNVWTTQVEWIAAWRRSLLVELGGYDENVGIGAATPWQSAEGQELMLRVLATGARAWYDPDWNGHDREHDRGNASADLISRARAYGRGMGFVLRTHRCGRRLAAQFLVRSAGGALISAAMGQGRRAQFFAATALGRMEGLLGRCVPIGLWLPKS
jgi:glycosyltransferase involved in cell wall biosynthesis